MKKICVFCGSSMGFDPIYKEKALELANYLIEKDHILVYGGANVGLMKVIADRMLEAGKEVIGVMPQHLVDKEVAHHQITKLHVVESMAKRKDLLIEISDAFIAMPGGFGTLDELAEVLVLDQLQIISKPLGLYNVNGYFDHLIEFIELGVTEGFVRQEHRKNVFAHEGSAELCKMLSDYKPVEMAKWLKDIQTESYQ
ncbi:MAG: TIGR00730 family Rossman fold protein [Bacteroidales bacterium]|nr:TIGR00730 family Rossman fold protein [Bacteroidales bacterium]